MGQFTKCILLRMPLWVSLVFICFIYSFEFDKDIEIYKFGAAGWPRAVLGMLAARNDRQHFSPDASW